MTAIVGILNKRAAVLAADSALTVVKGDRMKIYVPWEVIFKLYYDKHGHRQFDSIKEYAEDFYLFLQEEKFFCSSEQQKDYLDGELATYYNNVKAAAKDNMEKEIDAMDDNVFLTKRIYCVSI